MLGAVPIGPEGGPNRYFVYRLDAAAALWQGRQGESCMVIAATTAVPLTTSDRHAPWPDRARRAGRARSIGTSRVSHTGLDPASEARSTGRNTRSWSGSASISPRAIFIACDRPARGQGSEAHDVIAAPTASHTEPRRFPSAVACFEASTQVRHAPEGEHGSALVPARTAGLTRLRPSGVWADSRVIRAPARRLASAEMRVEVPAARASVMRRWRPVPLPKCGVITRLSSAGSSCRRAPCRTRRARRPR